MHANPALVYPLPHHALCRTYMQATVKETGNENRLVLALKLLTPMTGPPNLLASLIAFEVAGGTHAGGNYLPYNDEMGNLASMEGGKSMRRSMSKVSVCRGSAAAANLADCIFLPL